MTLAITSTTGWGRASAPPAPSHCGPAAAARRGARVVGQIFAAHDDGMRLAAELAGELGALGDGAEGILVELPVLVENVNEDIAHARSFLSSSQAMICSTVSFVSSSSMIWPASFWGG